MLGASSLTYAEATETQQLPAWVDAHGHMVEYFGGATPLWVPDQLKSAITRPCRYEPGVNHTCEDLAAHYGAVVDGTWRAVFRVHPFGQPCTSTRSYSFTATRS